MIGAHTANDRQIRGQAPNMIKSWVQEFETPKVEISRSRVPMSKIAQVWSGRSEPLRAIGIRIWRIQRHKREHNWTQLERSYNTIIHIALSILGVREAEFNRDQGTKDAESNSE